jgi:hypothetical protein
MLLEHFTYEQADEFLKVNSTDIIKIADYVQLVRIAENEIGVRYTWWSSSGNKLDIMVVTLSPNRITFNVPGKKSAGRFVQMLRLILPKTFNVFVQSTYIRVQNMSNNDVIELRGIGWLNL